MRIKPSTWLTSDTHFGHSNITKWGHRPEGFEDLIIKNWNNKVRKNDTILHLGDLTLTSKEKTMAWTQQLNGRKFLIRGNHDGNSDSWYRDCGFEVIPAAFVPIKSESGEWFQYIFTHQPQLELPFLWFNVHGHLHGGQSRASLKSWQHLDVGVDPMGMEPILFQEVIDMFMARLNEPITKLLKEAKCRTYSDKSTKLLQTNKKQRWQPLNLLLKSFGMKLEPLSNPTSDQNGQG